MDKKSVLKDLSANELREELLSRLREQIRRNEEENARLREQIRQLMPQGGSINTVRISGAGGRIASESSDGRRRGPKVKNEQPLREIIVQVLKEAGEPLRVKEVLKRVREAGYVTRASNFAGIVNISLSTNTELFEKVDRGLYTLRDNVTSAVPDSQD